MKTWVLKPCLAPVILNLEGGSGALFTSDSCIAALLFFARAAIRIVNAHFEGIDVGFQCFCCSTLSDLGKKVFTWLGL